MTEPTFNQYAAPTAEVADVTSTAEYGGLNLFSSNGRIGRLRFLAYVTGAAIISNIVGGVAGSFVYIPFFAFGVITGIKRCHDVGLNGWWSVTTVIPLFGLLWALVPGDKGANRFGPPPPPNTTGVRILGVLFPILWLIAIVGIIAAVAIPQYKMYTERAKAAAQHQKP